MKLSRPGPCGPAGTPRISRPFKQLSRSRGQVTHVILTRSPLNPPPKNRGGPVRLACVKHAASVRPEPGSNSPNKTQPKPKPAPTKETGNKPGPVQQKPEKKQPRTQPDTPHNPPTPRKPQPNKGPSTAEPEDTRSTGRKKQHPKTPTTTSSRRNRAQPDPNHGNRATRTPEPTPPQQGGSKTLRRAQAHPPAHPPRKGSKPPTRPPTKRKQDTRAHRTPNPGTPRNPPPHPNKQEQNERETQKTPEARENTTDKPEQPPKKRETPTPPPKPRTQNMTHYRDLKQHTHRDSTIRIRGPPPPGSARGASVSRTSEADSGPEPAVTGLLRLSSPRPPSGHWISPSPLGPERTLRTGGEAVKPRDGEPAHNAGPPSCPSCPGRFFAPAPRQGRRATARVRRPLRTSTTPPASSCSWAIGASSSSTLTLLR